MREAIANGEHDVRKALIACLLVFCFETLQGYLVSVSSVSYSGLVLFYESMAKYDLPPVSCVVNKRAEGRLLEGYFLHAAAGLDLHVIFFMDTRSERIHRALILWQNRCIMQMPTTISDLREARDY
jgi:hypothetical protein